MVTERRFYRQGGDGGSPLAEPAAASVGGLSPLPADPARRSSAWNREASWCCSELRHRKAREQPWKLHLYGIVVSCYP